MSGYLLALACIFGVNLLPAFGRPTWAVLVFFRLNSDLAAVPLVLLGALAAASGRLVLAGTSRRFRSRFSRQRLESLEAAEDALVGSRGRAIAGLGLFALSPVPSAQLFVAAGLLSGAPRRVAGRAPLRGENRRARAGWRVTRRRALPRARA